MSKVSNFIGMSFPNEQNSIQSKDTSQNVPIRTLFVALIEEHITEDMVRKYFSIFGDVELVEIHYNRYNKFGSGFVQFKDDAVCVLNHRREHCIEGCHFSVRAADMLCQPDFQRSFGPIPEQDSASHILVALNDDCLHEVFKYLNTIELSCAAEVCVRFNQEAKITFARKYRNLDITYGSSLTKRTAECLFHNFGSLIHSLSVNARLLESQSDFLALVSVQCTRLKELRLTYFNIDFVEQSDLRNKVRPLFRLLQKLHLTNYPNLEDMQKFLTTCNELKVLRIEYCHIGEGNCLKQKIGKLEEFYFSNNKCFGCVENALNRFIANNSSLLKLSITCNNFCSLVETGRLIRQHLPDLLELEFDEYCRNDFLQDISQVNSLRVLKINLKQGTATELMKYLIENETPIEHLQLYGTKIDDEVIEHISQMKPLKIMDLSRIKINIITLKKWLLNAQQLSLLKLALCYRDTIDIDNYNEILNAIKSRREKFKLSIEITNCVVDVPNEILVANQEIFHIKIRKYNRKAEVLRTLFFGPLRS